MDESCLCWRLVIHWHLSHTNWRDMCPTIVMPVCITRLYILVRSIESRCSTNIPLNKVNVGICNFLHCNMRLYNMVWVDNDPISFYFVVRYVCFIVIYSHALPCNFFWDFPGRYSLLYLYLVFSSTFYSPTWDSQMHFHVLYLAVAKTCKAKSCIHSLAVAAWLCYCLTSYICLAKWRKTAVGIKIDLFLWNITKRLY